MNGCGSAGSTRTQFFEIRDKTRVKSKSSNDLRRFNALNIAKVLLVQNIF
jgi:hypothetical protein